MFSYLGLARHRAVFLDDNGSFVGTICFEWTWSDSYGLKKKTFDYDGGSYNTNPQATRFIIGHFFVNEYVYVYNVGFPDPIKILPDSQKLLFTPDNYKKHLHSHFVEELHKAYNSGIWEFLTFRNIVIGLLIIGVIWYIFSGSSGGVS